MFRVFFSHIVLRSPECGCLAPGVQQDNRTFWCGCHYRVMCLVGANVADGTLFLACAAFRFDPSTLSGSVCGYTLIDLNGWFAPWLLDVLI